MTQFNVTNEAVWVDTRGQGNALELEDLSASRAADVLIHCNRAFSWLENIHPAPAGQSIAKD